MILFLVGFLILLVCRIGFAFSKHLDRQESERRQFYLALANDLEKLDAIIAKIKKQEPKQPAITTYNKRWAGRN